jgi:DUF971 family protein
MNRGEPVRAVRVAPFPNGELGIVWEDGHESYYPGRTLRCACPCAQCVDEMSGHKLLQDEAVPEDIQLLEIQPVGHYAIAVRWSDGHDTGIFAFERLRRLCPCCQ